MHKLLRLVCRLVGHDWVGAGWGKGREGHLANYWRCHRCREMATVEEPPYTVVGQFGPRMLRPADSQGLDILPLSVEKG